MKNFIIVLAMVFTFSSCYVHKVQVGEGAQSGVVEKAKQHNFIGGLASGKTPDTQKMAKGSKNYEVVTKHSFIDLLISGITFGIYNPTTVSVRR